MKENHLVSQRPADTQSSAFDLPYDQFLETIKPSLPFFPLDPFESVQRTDQTDTHCRADPVTPQSGTEWS